MRVLAGSRKECFPESTLFDQECFSGKKPLFLYPLMALVTGCALRNVSFRYLLETSLLGLYNREVSQKSRKERKKRHFWKEKTLSDSGWKGPQTGSNSARSAEKRRLFCSKRLFSPGSPFDLAALFFDLAAPYFCRELTTLAGI